MIRNDEGRRYSDDVYATKDEVKAIYNLDDIQDIWEKIRSYRFYYDYETELRDIDSNPYKICLTRRLLSSAYNFEHSLVSDRLLLSSLSKENQEKFLQNCKCDSLSAVSRSNGIEKLSPATLDKLARRVLESLPSNYFLLDAYSKAFDEGLSNESITKETIEKINDTLIGNDGQCKYRKTEIKDIINILKAPDCQKTDDYISQLISFLNDTEIPVLLRALGIIYVFDFLRPFEYCNEETASILAKTFVKTKDLGITGFVLDFESISFSRSERYFQRLSETERTLDLTYFYERILPFLIENQKKEHQMLLDLVTMERNQPKPNISSLPGNPDQAENNTFLVDDHRNLALPAFPMNISPEEIQANAEKLHEVHPHLKKKQCHFYAGHCTIGLHYTIDDFKLAEHTVYETARTSMDDLANRGFYKKEKISNKFIYTPIPINEEKI